MRQNPESIATAPCHLPFDLIEIFFRQASSWCLKSSPHRHRLIRFEDYVNRLSSCLLGLEALFFILFGLFSIGGCVSRWFDQALSPSKFDCVLFASQFMFLFHLVSLLWANVSGDICLFRRTYGCVLMYKFLM
ncbi:hypothetical protein F2Q70_00033873 [Brassica cretica]|uniref:Uncharacterized protein n=1 Tax=Brassica cretica TaxID=69181 RepID=A0A8S9JTX5_BRACR|nr:hypothetical protein F2Q70_00033873 [Brassica cretica]